MTQPELKLLVQIEPNMSLFKIMALLDDFDAGIINLSPEQIAEINSQLKQKPDNCRLYLDALEDQASRQKAYAAEHTKRAKAIENRAENFKQYHLVECFRTDGKIDITKKISGEKYTIWLKKSEPVEISENFEKPDALTMTKYPGFVRKKETYEWDKTAIKEALSNDTHEIPFATLKEKFHPQFNLKKDY